MSLIEKAAKRLEELQRAGAVFADGRSPPLRTAGAVLDDASTSLSGDGHAGIADATGVAGTTSAGGPLAPAVAVPLARLQTPLRRVELDFAKLAAQSLVSPDNPHSAIAHEFRTIKRPIIRNAMDTGGDRIENGNLVAVTSSLPGEGKTFVATNLAISIAMEVDRTVMLVDGDVAHPSLPGMLGTPPTPGLLDLLVRDDLDINDVLVQTNIERLTVLPSGSRDRRSTELLASERMTKLLRELAVRFPDRIIVFDSPPLLPTTEAPVLAGHMGQVVMVVGADSTPRQVVRQALALIEDCKVVLMLLNRSTKSMGSSYYGYYADYDPR